MPVTKECSSERSLGALECRWPQARGNELSDVVGVTSALAVLYLTSMYPVRVNDNEVHGMRVLRGVVTWLVPVPEMDDMAEVAEVNALEVVSVPSVDPVIGQVFVVAEDTFDALRALLAALETACLSRTAAAEAGCTDVDVVFAREECSDELCLAVHPLLHLVRWSVLCQDVSLARKGAN